MLTNKDLQINLAVVYKELQKNFQVPMSDENVKTLIEEVRRYTKAMEESTKNILDEQPPF